MFETLSAKVARDKDLPERAWRLDVLGRVLDGTIYDGLKQEFHQEQSRAGEYVPLRDRRPSVRYGLCRIVVESSVSFLFGEGRWPAVLSEDQATKDALADVLDESDLAGAMVLAATTGSVGSVALRMDVLKGRVFWTVMPTKFLTPTWDPYAPDTLVKLSEQYKLTGAAFRAAGYDIPDADLNAQFWWLREWDEVAENRYLPLKVADAKAGRPFVRDDARSVTHSLKFCPAVWVRNLPSPDGIDGLSTFRGAVETGIEIDYQLSQAGRGLKYQSDPLLVIKEPAAPDGDIVRSAGNAMIVSEKGDAKLLEIGGTAAGAVCEYVGVLREYALETIHGNRSSADKLATAQSGRAMELLYAPLINLVDKLRTPYGRALLRLCQMVALASQAYPLTAFGEKVTPMQPSRLKLHWPPYFPPTHQDKTAEASSLRTLREGGFMSQESGVRQTVGTWDLGEPDEELARVRADEAAADVRAKAQGAQVQDKQQLPA